MSSTGLMIVLTTTTVYCYNTVQLCSETISNIWCFLCGYVLFSAIDIQQRLKKSMLLEGFIKPITITIKITVRITAVTASMQHGDNIKIINSGENRK